MKQKMRKKEWKDWRFGFLGLLGLLGLNGFILHEPWLLFLFCFFFLFAQFEFLKKELKYLGAILGGIGLIIAILGVIGLIPV
jgi:hypothetical protein